MISATTSVATTEEVHLINFVTLQIYEEKFFN